MPTLLTQSLKHDPVAQGRLHLGYGASYAGGVYAAGLYAGALSARVLNRDEGYSTKALPEHLVHAYGRITIQAEDRGRAVHPAAAPRARAARRAGGLAGGSQSIHNLL